MDALIVVDVQNDFIEGGALEVAGGAEIVPLINKLMDEFSLVVATQDYHPEGHGSFAASHEGKNLYEVIDLNGLDQVLWPVHCVQGTPGANFAPGLDLNPVEKIFHKGTDSGIDSYSGFWDNGKRKSTGLAEYLRKQSVDRVFVVGLATDYCVKFTALDAIGEGFQTYLIEDAARGVNLKAGDVENAVKEMENAGVIVIHSDHLLKKQTATSA